MKKSLKKRLCLNKETLSQLGHVSAGVITMAPCGSPTHGQITCGNACTGPVTCGMTCVTLVNC